MGDRGGGVIIEALERELPPATLLLGPDPDLMLRAAYQCRAEAWRGPG